ncbi:FecCD family ABC transporter permease [Methanotorris formicicus]|uniref:Transport system permease protein n=1 Tax=Methanotorris formicicus Mc-S-70 TaxID=647171 RepID=H1KYM5_9EURY|nr:iron ABC transporter permease [Methanotorris formicicus]EHP86929.1 transport system permease protein [Methanotorris formicicus Mc-S-70]
MGAKRVVFLCVLLSSLIVISSIYSLAAGSVKITSEEVKNYILKGTTGNEIKDKIIGKLRILRTIGAIIAGMSIALAGILMQGYFRNPLADPYLTGVASGASLGVVLYIFTSILFGFGIPHNIWGMIISAYVGSLITMFIVINIARVVKQISTLLICGIMIGSIVYGFATIIIYMADYLEEGSKLSEYFMWGMGSVAGLTTEQIVVISIILIPISILTMIFLSKKLDANLLGEKYAISVGVDIKRLRMELILLSCILTATVVAFTGPIAFVGIMCPILARMLCGTSKHIYVMPVTALLGSLFLIIADILVRPGVVVPESSNVLGLSCPLSIIGAPIAIFIYLKIRKMGI